MQIHSPIYIPSSWLRSGMTILIVMAVCLLDASLAFANAEAASGRSGSLLNILLLGCIAYFLVRSFRRRSDKDDDSSRPGTWAQRDEDDTNMPTTGKSLDRHEAARQAWSVLSSDDVQQPDAQPAVVQDAGFNEGEFLEGAKLFFTRFQQADTEQELADLKSFLAEGVYSDALIDIAGNTQSVRTEVMLVTARLMEMKSEGNRTLATVFYDAQLRKGAVGEQAVQTRTAWEFSRDDSVDNALWILEKINKVDH